MSFSNFILALTALIASLQGMSFEEASAQIVGTLAGRSGVPMNVQYISDGGNGVNPTFDNTGISLPDSWGDTSLAIVIGGTNGGALRGRTGFQSRVGVISRIDWYVASSAMADGTFISLNVGKGISPLAFHDGSTPIAFYVRLANVSGQLKLQIAYPTNSGEVISTWSGVVSTNTVFQTYVEYNVAQQYMTFRVNGETVVTRAFDGAAVQSIGSLIIGSSSGSTGRNITVLADLILEHVLVAKGVAPTNVAVSSPTSGATNIEVSAPLVCAGSGADTWEIRYETVTPPVGAYTSLGAAREYGATNLDNNTTYYVQCRATNENGSTVSAISSFTTTAVTSTGTHPLLLVNAGRQANWSQIRTEYLANPTNPTTIFTSMYKDAVSDSNRGTAAYLNYGMTDAWLAQVPGNDAALHCARAWDRSDDGGASLMWYATGADVGPNEHREYFIDWVLIYDWCYQSWDQAKRDDYLAKLNQVAVHIVNSYFTGWRCGDGDQPVANYFGLTALYYATRDYNPSIVTTYANPMIGGITENSTIRCTDTLPNNRTGRHIVKRYFGTEAVGGAWFEGTEYIGSAFLGILGCEAVRTTAAGNAPCVEIDSWVDDLARFSAHQITRDYRQIMHHGDEDVTRQFYVRYTYDRLPLYMYTTSMTDGVDRQNMMRQILNLHAAYPAIESLVPARILMFANPNATAAPDLSALPKCYQSPAYGIHTWNDGVLTTDTHFWAHIRPEGLAVDHLTNYWGDVQMYRRGEFALTHPFSYAGVTLNPEGTNTVAVEGLVPSPTNYPQGGTVYQYKRINGYTCGADYLYAAGTTGGMMHPNDTEEGVRNYYDPPPRYVHEQSRSIIYLPSATKTYDSIVLVDRINAEDPQALEKFDRHRSDPQYPATYPHSPYADQQRIIAFPRWTSYLHQWVEPVVSALKTSWTLPDGQIVEDQWLSPTDVTITKIDQRITPSFANGTTHLEERRWNTKIEPTSNNRFSVLERVVTARNLGATAPVITKLTVTGDCGAVLVTRSGNDDRVVVWNTAQGADITQLYPTRTQATAVLETARYRVAGTCTIPWTQTTANSKVLLLDLNPALGWTSNLNGAGPVAITEDSGGLEELAVSGIQAHSLVVVGS